MSLPLKLWEVAGGALIAGAVCALLDGVNAWLYMAAVGLSVLGALPAGTQHRTLGGAALRGATVGAIWGIALVGVHHLTGLRELVPMGSPVVAIVPYATLPNCVITVGVYLLAWRRDSAAGRHRLDAARADGWRWRAAGTSGRHHV